jgi:hypothetical protein
MPAAAAATNGYLRFFPPACRAPALRPLRLASAMGGVNAWRATSRA